MSSEYHLLLSLFLIFPVNKPEVLIGFRFHLRGQDFFTGAVCFLHCPPPPQDGRQVLSYPVSKEKVEQWVQVAIA